MRKIIVAALMSAMIALACNTRTTLTTSGQPNPPFEGEKPQDAYISKCEPGVYGGQIIIELLTDPRTLNVIRATDEHTTTLLWQHLFRCLVDYRNGDDPPGYDPGLCVKYESSPDLKEWTFYLRKGIRWSDGEPFNADDVIFSYDVTLDQNVDGASRDIFIEGTDESGKPVFPKLEKIDDYTVRFKLSKANSEFLDAIFNLYLIPRHKWESVWKEGKFNEKMKVSDDPSEIVGLGPFRLKEYISGERIVLERNPYFWKVDSRGNRLPYLDRLIFLIVKDFNTVQSKFEAGELDAVTRVRANDFANIKRMESDSVKVIDIGATTDTRWITLNQNTGTNPKTGKPYLEGWKQRLYRDQKFRQAVSFAIDREGLANTVYVGRAAPLYSFVTPADKVWFSDDIQKYPYNPELAKRMLAEMGLKDTDNDGFLEDAEGHTAEIVIHTNSENQARVQSAAFIAQSLQRVGIKASSNPLAMNSVVEMMQSRFNFDAILLGWVGGIPPGPSNVKNTVLSSGLNHTCFPLQKTPSTEWEARLDQIIHKLEGTVDLEERKRMYAEVQRIWSEQLPEINLVVEKEAIAYRNKFSNIKPSPLRPRLTWNAEEIYLKQ